MRPRRLSRLVVALALALASRAHAAVDACAPCSDAAHRRPVHEVMLTSPGRAMLVQAAGRMSLRLGMDTFASCTWDSLAATPGWTCTTASRDTLTLWRQALERFAASGAVTGDSANAVGMNVLRAIDRTAVLPRDTDGRVPNPMILSFKRYD